ncbi:hypothetical protein [Actinomadura parmotrematis]|uniref:DUF11 domain-containing protein n=1 Tax=Actinomadura parmotrematis TaxID=2864039 RepID=A0ABS7FUV0_9ACTN|nr:hypothetical protein [Actinomadura parmotrematis]MBW8484190.1 hypothetical protein [Actinomadura parmotrematis]
MRSIITARAAVLAGAFGAALAVAPAAHAAGKVDFAYSAPEVSEEGDNVVWTWTVGAGDGPVEKVVLTHRLTPHLKVASVSKECTVLEAAVRCEYGALKAGQRKRGVLVADIPVGTSGSVQISGRVTWRQGGAPGAATGAATPGVSAASAEPVGAAGA